MPSSPVIKVVEHLRKTVLRREEDTSDGQLLRRFLENRDEVAFAALVRRHGPMVWGVCWRISGQAVDAEDAFQAAFLVLVRKAATLKQPETVGNWLYGVACHTALKARAISAKLRAREKQVISMPEPAKEPGDDPDELRKLLDQELSALPDKYRLPVVLCDLEGRTRKAVAAQLRIPEGTLSSRLSTAHQMLAKRLARHGLVVSGGSLAALLAQNAASACVPASVVCSTIKSATLVAVTNGAVAGVVSAKVAALTEGVMKAMLLTKLKAVIAIVLVLGFMITGATGLAYRMAAAQGDQPRNVEELPATSQKQEQKREKEAVAALSKEVDELQGEWVVVAMEVGEDGQASADDWKGMKWMIKGTKVTVISKGPIRKFSFTLDPAKSPKQIDVTRLEGPLQAEKMAGIYTIEGRRLRICLAEKGRPKEFATAPGDGLTLITLEKQVPPASARKAPDDKPTAADAPLSDMLKIQGKWVSVACEMNGFEYTGKLLKDFRFDPSFDGKNYVIWVGTIRMEGTFELNPTSNPKTITLKSTLGTNLGIYTFDGDQLRICICDNRKDGRRPTEFKTKAGSDHSLILFKRVSRESEVREVVDRFLKTALAGETEKVRALAAPAVSDQQLARFKGLTKTLSIANVYVTAGSAPTSHGNNAGRALVVTEEIEIADGNKKSKGRVVLTLLKDDERLKTKGWLVWDIDLRDDAGVANEVKKLIDRYQPKQEAAPKNDKEDQSNLGTPPIKGSEPRLPADLELVVGKELQYRTKDNPKLRPVPLAGVSKLLRDGQTVVLRISENVSAELVIELIKMSLQRKQVSVTVFHRGH